MEPFLEQLSTAFTWVLHSTLRVTVLIALILALKALFRDKLPVRWHAALWLVLVARMILPWAPESPVSVFNLLPSAAQSIVVDEAVLPARENSRSFRVPAGPRQRELVTAETRPSVEERVSAIEAARSPAAPAVGARIKAYWLPILWAAGALGVLAYVFVTNRLFLRRIYRQRPLTDDATLKLLEDCKQTIGVHQPLLVYPAPGRTSPALLGFIRPRLLMPSGMLDSMGPAQLRHVFLHELAHIKRYDIPLNWLVAVLQAIHWFNPAVWYAFYRMRADRELACDALALSRLEPGEPQEYGNTIVRLLERVAQPRPLAGMAGILENKTQLKRRIEMITRFKGTSYRWNTLSVALLVLLGVVGLTNANKVSGATEASVAEPPPERTLTFPENPAWIEGSKGGAWSVRYVRSSRLKIRNWNPDGYPSYSTGWHDLGEALGQVTIPAGNEVGLTVTVNPWGNLAPLAGLPPDTLQYIQFWNRTRVVEPQWITRDDLRIVAGQQELRALEFINSMLSDDVLVELSAMTNLRELTLEGAQVTDAGLVHIAAMPWLESLSLKGTQVTDAGIVYLSDMTALRRLSLDNTAIGDVGLANLGNLISLESLSLNNTNVTDAGLSYLKHLPSLMTLPATNTQVTPEGLDQLPVLVPSKTESFVRSQVRVGMILSHYQATGPSAIGRPYSYTHQKKVLKALIDGGFDVYAVIDAGSKDLGELPSILEGAGIDDVVIVNTDRNALEGLDVIVSGNDYNIRPWAAATLRDVIRGGVGFINYGVLGSVSPGNDDATIQEIIGVRNGRYWYKLEEMTAEVLEHHPILGPLEAGESFTLSWLDSLRGQVDGTPLLGTPAGVSEDIVPLYVRQLGTGRIINMQWVGLMDPSHDFTAEDFMTRCVLWAAKFPLD